jgi:polar amino acid transport system permease protein
MMDFFHPVAYCEGMLFGVRIPLCWRIWWHHPGWVWARVLLTLAVLGWLLIRGAEHVGYTWQWSRLWPYVLRTQDGLAPGPLLLGLAQTIQVSLWGLGGMALGAVSLALMRLSASPVARAVSRVVLEAVRNTPLIVQIFFLYFVAAPILGIDRFVTAIVALALFEGAYASEILRAGILAVPQGQWEAGRSLGLSSWHLWTRVVLPQAVRTVLPALVNQGVSLIKDSALVSTIAVYDLTMRAGAVVAETFLVFETWFFVAGMYLVLTGTLSWVAFRMHGPSSLNPLPGGCHAPSCTFLAASCHGSLGFRRAKPGAKHLG